MTRNFLEGARKERIQYTPTGLSKAWINLSAATKVYVLTIVGLIVSVSQFFPPVYQVGAEMCSSCLRSSFSLARNDSILLTASLEDLLGLWSAVRALNGQYQLPASSLPH